MSSVRFLTLAEVSLIHQDQISRYGGSFGLRDSTLLSSALAMPESSYSGAFLHEDIFQMASAYLFHICQNHPFIDGNKRVALASCLVFLDLNVKLIGRCLCPDIDVTRDNILHNPGTVG